MLALLKEIDQFDPRLSVSFRGGVWLTILEDAECVIRIRRLFHGFPSLYHNMWEMPLYLNNIMIAGSLRF